MSYFETGTKNHAIFQLSAPYANPYQGRMDKWLFVCSAGLLRSPTGAAMAVQKGFNARSCGSHTEYALIPVSANLIYWADKICFVSKKNYDRVCKVFDCDQDVLDEIETKKVVLDIRDEYEYMQPELVQLFEDQLFNPKTKAILPSETAVAPAPVATPATV